MISFIRKTIFFTLIAVLCILSVSRFLKFGYKHSNSHSVYKLLTIFEKKVTPDVLILGSSVAEGGFNSELLSRELNLNVYNAAISGRKINDWICVADQFLSLEKEPQAIVMDVFPGIFNSGTLIYNPQDFFPYLNNMHVQNSFRQMGDPYRKMSFIPGYELTAINFLYIKRSLTSWTRILQRRKKVEHKDFVSVPPMPFNENDLTHFTKILIDSAQVRKYRNLMEVCKEKNVKVILVGMPIYAAAIEKYPEWKSVIDTVETLVGEFQNNAFFMNYSQDSTLIENKQIFSNNTHMNSEGALILSDRLVDDIQVLLLD